MFPKKPPTVRMGRREPKTHPKKVAKKVPKRETSPRKVKPPPQP
jgi:hypothetical protein